MTLPKKILFVGLLFSLFLLLPKSISAQIDRAQCVIGDQAGYDFCTDYTLAPGILGSSQCTGGAQVNSAYICCETREAVCSTYQVRNPMCGSSDLDPARVKCGYEDWGLMCWGNNYRTQNDQYCSTDPNFPCPAEGTENRTGFLDSELSTSCDQAKWVTDSTQAGVFPSITYNGTNYDQIPEGRVCFCDPALIGGCQCPGYEQEIGGEGESRLWFPHLRLIAALSTIAQSIFNPHPSSLVNNTPDQAGEATLTNPDLLTSKITKHQGIDDQTDVVNKDKDGNNSSLKVDKEAPDAQGLLNLTQDPYRDTQCVVPAKNNPGDDLLGPKIEARLLYTQKYEYEACPILSNCTPDGWSTQDPATCCSLQQTRPECIGSTTFINPDYICQGPPQVERDTKGQASVFIKNPLVEYIYDAMVEGSSSLFKRFMPSMATHDFEEIPSSVAYNVSAIANNEEGRSVTVKAGDGSASYPVFYVPHIGSLKKYWLEDLQKALRPEGISAHPGLPPPGGTGSCIAPDPDTPEFQNDILDAAIADGIATKKVPRSVLEIIYRMEALPYYSGYEPYNCTYTSGGYLGLMQIGDDAYNRAVPENERSPGEERQCVKQSSVYNRCYPVDTMEIAARVLLQKIAEWPNGRITTQTEVRRSACGYYGGDEPDTLTQNFAAGYFDEAQCRGGDCDNMSYADIVCLASDYCDGVTWPARLNERCMTQ